MLVNKSVLGALFFTLKTTFQSAFKGAPTVWDKVAMKITSTTAQNDYAWLSDYPRMRKWVGDKVVKALKAFKYSLVNDDFEVTIRVKRNDIEDDQLGIYSNQAQMAGHSAAKLPEELVFDLVGKSFELACYDGQYFCDTDHPVGEGANQVSVSNKGTMPLSAVSVAAVEASYGVARTAMRTFKDDEGRPLGIHPNILLVPPALETVAKRIVTAEKIADEDNPFRGTAEVVVADQLTSDTAWWLLDTTKPVKPFIYQERKAPHFVRQDDPQSEVVFDRAEFKYGAEARAAAGFAFWQFCYGSTGTGE